MPQTLTTPTVHMNGSGFDSLWDGYDAADDKIIELRDAFGKIEFNARDYYPQGPDAWNKAVDERQAINQKIRDIKNYLDEHRIALDSQRPANRK